MTKSISISPLTRLEGHGKIDILLDEQGDVDQVHLKIIDFKGFEKFCEGRPAEEMPVLTQKICGVCPTAHHTASVKALDDLFDVTPPVAGRLIRELIYHAFVFEDHLLHFYFLGGPDLMVGVGADKERRNLFGVMEKLGRGTMKEMLKVRKGVRQIISILGGNALYPVHGLPGGVSMHMSKEKRDMIKDIIKGALEFAGKTMKIYHYLVSKKKGITRLMKEPALQHKTYYMGMLDGKGNLAFYDGDIKVVSPDGDEFVKFRAPDYKEHIKERVDPSSYMKILYLAGVGWRGYVPGKDSGIYRVGPLARINVASGLSTPMAHSEYERMIRQFGGKPIHNTLAYHQARLVEVLYCAERMEQLIHDERIMDRKIRVIPHSIRYEGVGICEAPRGTLIHHYLTDENAIIKRVNLMVATQHNAGALTMTVERAAKLAIQGGKISEGKLNLIESLLRSYDPCLACATHCLGTPLNIQLSVRDHAGRIIKKKNI